MLNSPLPFALIPLLLALLLYVGAPVLIWRWAMEMLRQARAINQHLEQIASALEQRNR